MIDFMLRTGPFGDGFGANLDGTSMDDLLDYPHGRDFGALVPRIPRHFTNAYRPDRTRSGRLR